MMRLEYIGRGDEYDFSDTLLVGKDILAAYKDGVGSSKIVKGITPEGKQVRYKNSIGNMAFAVPFEPGEAAIVLYQDGDIEVECIELSLQADYELPDGYARFPYNASFFVDGTLPINITGVIKPDWMDIDVSGNMVLFSGTPDIADAGTDIEVSFSINNTCNSIGFHNLIDVIITPAEFTDTTFISGDRLNDVERANLKGTPGVTLTVTLTLLTNTNGGVLKVNGSPAFEGNTWGVLLDSLGKGTLDVEINGSPTPGTSVIRGLFNITSASDGSIGSRDAYQISKIFT